jgi:hypothetical protein
MSYINQDTFDYPVSAAQIIAAHPNTSFPIPFEPPDNFFWVSEVLPPSFNSLTQKVSELSPEFVDTTWRQRWLVVPLSVSEIAAAAAALVPISVTRVQARMALAEAGLLLQVDGAVNAMTGLTGEFAKIKWFDATQIDRGDPLVNQMGALLNKNPGQMDALFVRAAQL